MQALDITAWFDHSVNSWQAKLTMTRALQNYTSCHFEEQSDEKSFFNIIAL